MRALGDLRIGELLNLFRVLLALLALVFVERHGCFLCIKCAEYSVFSEIETLAVTN
jgi:hypothetical protein